MDMLVKLYDLPDNAKRMQSLVEADLRVRRALAHERATLLAWVETTFGAEVPGWIDETAAAFTRVPATCFIATHGGGVVGFCCYDCTCLGFIGPVGVATTWRFQGVGEAVLHAALQAMRAAGYGYAIVGGVGAPAFFARAARAVEIPGSTPGVYAGGLDRPSNAT